MIDIKKLPKIDLHCHLDGSLTASMIQRHTDKKITADMLSVPEDCESLTEYLKRFALPLECLQDEDGLLDGAYSFVEEAAKENMKYMEVRFAPMLSVHDGLDCSRVIEAVREGLLRGKRDFGVDFGIISCAMRNHTEEQNMEMLHTASQFLSEGVCAIDLAGDESAYPNEMFLNIFREAKRIHMPFTIHSGETGNVDNVRSAILMGARRIGHGIAMQKDPKLMEMCAEAGIGVEMCPTSNFQTKAVRSWEEYPFMKYLDAGIKVSIHTDNRTVSNTTMTGELTKIYEQYGRSGELIIQVLKNAADTAFHKEIGERFREQWMKEI